MINYPVRSAASPIEGRGAFASAPVPRRSKIGEVTGDIISLREARKRARGSRRIYLIDVSDSHALDCSEGNLLRLLNHSCAANAFLRIYRNRVEVYARRDIEAGEEITVDYGETPHGGGMTCTCGKRECRNKI
jgi:SET domain-containing protein